MSSLVVVATEATLTGVVVVEVIMGVVTIAAILLPVDCLLCVVVDDIDLNVGAVTPDDDKIFDTSADILNGSADEGVVVVVVTFRVHSYSISTTFL